MLRKDKALLESLTRKYGKRNVLNTLNEYGNTERGQYMLGRLHRRNVEKEDMFRGADDAAFRHNKGNWETFDKGYEDEGIDIPTLKNKTIRFNHDVYKMKDMDKLSKKFINYIEKSDAILQYIVECMIYNQKGEKNCSPLPEIIPMFEEDVLGYECTPDMKKAIERAFNEWWYYTESYLMSNYNEE
jgi:hypothetical protein